MHEARGIMLSDVDGGLNMRVTAVRTLRCAKFPNMVWVQVETDDGLVGLGETFRNPRSVETYIHEHAAPYLLGRDPRTVEAHWQALSQGMETRTMGVETRALSAVDIALWDLIGKGSDRSVAECLGGPVRDAIGTYNTCAGYGYNVFRAGLAGAPVGSTWETREGEGPYEDLAAWRTNGKAGELARSLLDSGITAMKIWPFDDYSEATGGQYISLSDLNKAARPFHEIRDAVGMDMEIAVELHSVWSLPAALRIAEALEPIRPLWFEDPIRMDNLKALQEFTRSTRVPTTLSETLATRFGFREALEAAAVDIVMLDPGWAGGISESRRIAALAETYHRPVAPHDCTGPVVYVAGVQLCMATPNAMIQESVRAYYTGWYREVLTALPSVSAGMVHPPEGPGLGSSLRSEFLARSDVSTQESRL